MFERERRTLAEVVFLERTHPLELLGGASAIARGLWVMAHAASTAAYATPVTRYLESLFPTWVWGFLVLLGGVVQVLGVARDDTRLRRAGSFALVALLGVIMAGVVVRDGYSIVVPLYGTMFVLQLWVGARLWSSINTDRVRVVPRNGPKP